MTVDQTGAGPERQQTDESLRIERGNAEHRHDAVSAFEVAEDAAIDRARALADQLLAAARERAGEQPSATPAWLVKLARVLEDRAIVTNRESADDARRSARLHHLAATSNERERTDDDLSQERCRSDDALAMRDAFLGIAGHELRNMLSAMTGFAELIEQATTGRQQEARVLGHAQNIQRAGARMNRIIGDLLDVASIDAGALMVTRQTGDLSQLVHDAVNSLCAQARAKDISLTAEIAEPTRSLEFDMGRLLQVLVNLLSNAIKFTPRHGKVVLCLDATEHEVKFTVRDTGIGMPTDMLELIFDRFRQVSQGDRRGLGLGLFISRCIVQGHGGRIWAESELGVGSSVCFTLPLVSIVQPEPASSPRSVVIGCRQAQSA